MASYRHERSADLAKLLGEARAMKALLDLGVKVVDAALLRAQIARWVIVLEDVVLDSVGDDLNPRHATPTVKSLIGRALGGANLDVDGDHFSLHDMTQMAVALSPAAKLVVRNSEGLAPLEKASIGSVARGAVQFA